MFALLVTMDVRVPSVQQNQRPAGSSATMQTGLMLSETVEELREQVEISLREVAILKEEVDTLTKENTQLQGLAADRQNIAVSSVNALAKAEAAVKAFRAEKSR